MISVEQAANVIMKTVTSFGTEEIPLEVAIGRILREPLRADRDFPPFDRVTMDGIAISYADFQAGTRQFPLQSTQLAGSPQQQLSATGSCIEVMTGAMCPVGTDVVIPYEQIQEEVIKGQRVAVLQDLELQQGQNIHNQGLDRIKDEVLVEAGRFISPAEIAVAASIGKSTVTVSKLPQLALITTGDELVNVEDQPLPYQIRKSNVPMLQSALQQLHIQADTYHFRDDKTSIQLAVSRILQTYDVLILSGGVSKGKADHIPGVLDELGVEKLFHKIKQRPGKPLWFGKKGERVKVFALPGNPVSTFVGYNRYVKPWLQKSMGIQIDQSQFAKLESGFSFQPDLTYFLQVKVRTDEAGTYLASPVDGHGSGDFANLLRCDGFLELPRGRNDFHAGEVFPYIPFR